MRALLWLLLLAQAGSFDTTFRAGLAALQQNDLSQAREQLESASQMEPRRAHVWLALARVYWKQHETELAGSAAEKAEQLATGDPVSFMASGFSIPRAGTTKKLRTAKPPMRPKHPATQARTRAPSTFICKPPSRKRRSIWRRKSSSARTAPTCATYWAKPTKRMAGTPRQSAKCAKPSG